MKKWRKMVTGRMSSEEKHSIYYNCSAEEALKKHIQKTKAIGWITVVILVMLLVYSIHQESTLVSCGLLLIGFILFLICWLIVYVQGRHLRDVFVLDCDPVKYYAVMDALEKKAKKQHAKSKIFLNKAQCCRQIKGRETEGLEYLKKVQFQKLTMQVEAIRLSEFAHYSVLRKDRASFEMVKKDLEELPKRIRRKYKTEEQLYQQIVDYVIAYGNRLSVVDEARELLDKCVL